MKNNLSERKLKLFFFLENCRLNGIDEALGGISDVLD